MVPESVYVSATQCTTSVLDIALLKFKYAQVLIRQKINVKDLLKITMQWSLSPAEDQAPWTLFSCEVQHHTLPPLEP